MESISLEEFLAATQDDPSTGARLHSLRLLKLLASAEDRGKDSPLTYSGAKKLVDHLQIDTPEKLKVLFSNAGLGELNLEIQEDRIRAILTRPVTQDPKKEAASSYSHTCDFERGLIDASMELYLGKTVKTEEIQCRYRGDVTCVYEAIAQEDGTAYIPGTRLSLGSPDKTRNELKSWFMEMTMRELARCRRHERHLSVLYIDIDGLGSINTAQGRSAGDKVIGAVWSAISQGARKEDFLWYHGEDEFALVLAEIDEAGSFTVARRIANQIRSAAALIDVSATVSACIGIASFPTHGKNVFDLFSSARSALHLAKSKGKGEIESASQLNLREPSPIRETPIKQPRSASRSSELETAESVQEVEPRREDLAENQISLLIGTNSPILLNGLKQIFSQYNQFEVLGETTQLPTFLTVMADLRPDLLLADIEFATDEDFSISRSKQELNLPGKIILMVDEIDADVMRLVIDFNVEGVVYKNCSASELVAAVRRVYGGQASYPEKIHSAITQIEKDRTLLKELSEREIEVLKLVAEGKSNSQISDELFITVNTVRFHLANIYQKLNVSNRTEAANFLFRKDISQEDQ